MPPPPSPLRGLLPRRPTCAAAALLPSCPSQAPATVPLLSSTQTRNATFIRRPRRPFQFTQLVQLSDGSTFTLRTTSPAPVYRSITDTRNHILWQPSEKMLQNIEHDEAGKLAAFRDRFGRDFDLEKTEEEREALREHKRRMRLEAKIRGGMNADQAAKEAAAEIEEDTEEDGGMDMLGDVISEYSKAEDTARLKGQSKVSWKENKKGKK